MHLLELEHVKANVERKLVELSFPIHQRKIILTDVFGRHNIAEEDAKCLHDSQNEDEFDEKVAVFKKKWDEIEKRFTKNNPPKFTSYFTRHNQLKIRNKMAKYIRERAGVSRGFGQNPVEYMSKTEIDDVAEGAKHKNVRLTTALQSLKGRVLRLYKDAAKAVYDEGPYKLDSAYSKFSAEYDTWMDLLQEDKEAHLKRFFVASCSALKKGQMKNPIHSSIGDTPAAVAPATTAPATITPTTVAPATVTPATLATASVLSAKRLSVSFAEFGIPEDYIPRSTLECLYQNTEALLNEPGATMQAASSDPRMMTVKSRHGKAPLLVKPLKN